MYFGTEKSLYNCCQHIFKHLVSFIQCLVNFFLGGFFFTEFRAVPGRTGNLVLRQRMVDGFVPRLLMVGMEWGRVWP